MEEKAPIKLTIQHTFLQGNHLHKDLMKELGFQSGIENMEIGRDTHRGESDFEFTSWEEFHRFVSLTNAVKKLSQLLPKKASD